MDNTEMNRHQRRSLRTREKLKDSTLALLLEKGYDAISIQNITDHADLGRATFYVHFKDKEDIVWALIRDGMDLADREGHQRFIDEGPVDSPVMFGYANLFQVVEKNKDLYRVMLGSQGSAMLTANVQDYLAEDLYRELETIPANPGSIVPIEIQAQIITGAVVRLIIWWLDHDNEYSPEQMALMLVRTLHPFDLAATNT